ncbi:Hexose_transporter [Hexamita inflata]|uniref:Hexose transporter n=1 Tax=Hexamita inflata TaxID=28002 RepID=A0AA86UI72_9EUKA|nr:Hexose transporter [Hexamita inflata]
MCGGIARGTVVNSLTSVIIAMYSAETNHFNTTGSIMAFLSTSILFGSMVGSFIATHIILKFGRKNSMLGFAIFSVITNAASMIPVHWIYLAIMKMLTGLCTSIIITTIPMLFSEFVAPHLRGIFASLISFFITFGILLSATLQLFIEQAQQTKLFYICFIPGTVFSGLVMILCIWVKEKNTQDNMSSSLVQNIEIVAKPSIFSKKYRKCLIIALAIGPSQAGCGMNPVIQYATIIFANIFDSPYSGTLGQILITAVNTALALIMLPFVRKIRRRILWFISMFGSIVCLSVELILELVYLSDSLRSQLKIVLTGLCLTFYCIGLGPLFIVIQAEVFPLEVKTQFMNISMSLSWIAYITTTQIYPLIPYWCSYIVFILIESISSCVLFKFLPETFNKTLDQIKAAVIDEELCIQNDAPMEYIE